MKLKNYALLSLLSVAVLSSCSKNSNVTPDSTKPVFEEQPAAKPAYCGDLFVYGAANNPSNPSQYQFPLIAGQNITAGQVTIGQFNGQYYVTIETYGDWYVKEAHAKLWDVPPGDPFGGNSNYANPAPGQFPVHWYGSSPYNAKEANFAIPSSVYQLDVCPGPQQVNVAVHAVVIKKGANGKTTQSETGWAGPGTKFTTQGNWARYLWCLEFYSCTPCI
jgi:hypothetical protein